MIYVSIEAVKSEGCGSAKGNGWHDVADPLKAVELQWRRFHRTWDHFGHGAAVTYRIEIAPESSPRRTKGESAKPLPVKDS